MKLKRNEIINRVIIMLTSVITLSIIILYVSKLFSSIAYPYPGEIRGAANILWADAISKGINPYDLSNPPESFSRYATVYSGLSLLISGKIAGLFGLDVIKTVYVFNVIALLMTALINALAACRDRMNESFSAVPFIVFAEGLSVFMYVSGKPGQLAVLLVSVAYYLCDRNKYPAVQAILMVAAFWDKQYFVICALPVFIKHVIDKNWKSTAKYSITGVVTGLSSLIFVLYRYPVFFIETFMSRSVDEGYYAITVQECLHNTLSQMYIVLKNYWQFAIPAIAGVCLCIVIKKIDIYQIVLICMTIFLLYFGISNGNFMVYHYELLVPPLLAGGARALIDIVNRYKDSPKIKWIIVAVCVCFTVAGPIHSYNSMASTRVLSDEEAGEYENLYSYIDSNSGKIFLGAAAAQYAVNHEGDYVISNGLSGYFTGMRMGGVNRGIKEENKLSHLLVPDADAIIEKSVLFEEERRSMIKNKEFSVLVFCDDVDGGIIDPDGELENYYHIVDSFELANTAGQKCVVNCWEAN